MKRGIVKNRKKIDSIKTLGLMLTSFLFLILFLSGCATAPSIRYYDNHESSQSLKESADRFRVTMKQFPAIANRRMMVRVFNWNDVPNAFVNFDDRYIVRRVRTSLPEIGAIL